ncbi:NAD(P)-binding protein [Streptomyces sp. NBC_00638]|nr:NAD(P)-binding protein [Streptomyces sp. NBC_00568]MCX5004646.1 NAD(P)-binding protein [Streptomyces sp. NBC_00638]
MYRITVVGGGFAGLTAAITAAEAGAEVTVYEAHHTLGGRARTAEGPYRTNEGPHALYSAGPHWTWLKQRDLIGALAPIPPLEAARLRLRHKGVLRRTPPFAMLKLLRRSCQQAPADVDFMTWATGQAGAEGARAAAHYSAVALFHHDPGSLSAAFVQERLRRAMKLPPEAHCPRGGWANVIDRMAARAWNLGVRMETLARVDTLPLDRGPVVVATSLDSARRLLKDASLTWTSGRTALVDLAAEPARRRVRRLRPGRAGLDRAVHRAGPHPRSGRGAVAPGADPDRAGRVRGRWRRARRASARPRFRGLARAGHLAARERRERPYGRGRSARHQLAGPPPHRPRRRRLPRGRPGRRSRGALGGLLQQRDGGRGPGPADPGAP